MTRRGDKVIPLDVRLDGIEKSMDTMNSRVDRLVITVTLLVGLSNAPGLIDLMSKIAGYLS